MSAAHLVAAALFLGISAYAIFGGADFGAGFWDLIAGGPEGGSRPRGVIERAIGPVWEANHVWLIFIFVILWTSFPEAYASITLTLYVPLAIAALGIVFRGASFAFRKVVVTTRYQRMDVRNLPTRWRGRPGSSRTCRSGPTATRTRSCSPNEWPTMRRVI